MNAEPRLAGKRIIVTGAARGLGREFAVHLATLGVRVLAVDVLKEELECTRAAARGRGSDLAIALTDVSSSAQTHALANLAADQMEGLDALVNNAAIVNLTRLPFDERAYLRLRDRLPVRAQFAVKEGMQCEAERGALLCPRRPTPASSRTGELAKQPVGQGVAVRARPDRVDRPSREGAVQASAASRSRSIVLRLPPGGDQRRGC